MFSAWLPSACINLNNPIYIKAQLTARGFRLSKIGNMWLDPSSAAACGRAKNSPCAPGMALFNGNCDLCSSGSFSIGLNCMLCPENYHAPAGGASVCLTCPSEQWSARGASQCTMKEPSPDSETQSQQKDSLAKSANQTNTIKASTTSTADSGSKEEYVKEANLTTIIVSSVSCFFGFIALIVAIYTCRKQFC